jgi:hypothetical protein
LNLIIYAPGIPLCVLKEVGEEAKSGFEKAKIRSSLIYMDIHIYHSKYGKPLFASAEGGEDHADPCRIGNSKYVTLEGTKYIRSGQPWRDPAHGGGNQ